MKLTLLLTLVTLVNAAGSVYSQSKGLTLSMKNATLQEVFNKIEDQSKFKFFYQNEQIDVNRTVSVNVDGAKVEDVLDKLFANANVKYRVLEDNLVLLTAEKLQQMKVTGTITSAKDGSPLAGVSVLEKGTTNGTMSDASGKYTLTVQGSSSVLVFSFIGFLPEEKTVGTQNTIDVTMSEDIKQLEEVVVIGYGQQKKSLVTGAISSVKSDALANSTFSRPDQAFEGKISGIQVVPTSGAPGAGINIRIRGYGSNGNSNPLYIVDGIKSGDISQLDPNEIQSMEVLKDAASAAIYGSEGGNGVVIITTKKGVAGKSIVTYDVQYAIQTPAHLAKELNATDYVAFMNEKNGSTGASEADLVPGGITATGYNTNWLKSLFTQGYFIKHSLSFSGGNEKTTFYTAFNYFNNDGIVTGNKDNYNRYDFRVNAENKTNNWLKVGTNLEFTHLTRRGINENGGEFGGAVGSALQLDPTTPVVFPGGSEPAWLATAVSNYNTAHSTTVDALKDAYGNYYGVSPYVAGEIRNPFVTQALNTGLYTQDKVFGDFHMDISPVKGLTFTSKLGLDLSFDNNHWWNPTFYYDDTNANTTTQVNDQNNAWLGWLWQNYATYNKKVGDHNFTLLAAMEASDKTHRWINGQASNMLAAQSNYAYFDYTTHPKDNASGSKEEFKTESYFGRLDYDYKGKYSLEGVLRRDGAGSSQVSPSKRWGLFPSFSAGWVISNESFFPKTFLSFAKVRFSWGQNGSLQNLPTSSNYAVYIGSTIGGQPITYPISNGQYLVGAEPTSIGNPNLTWETDQQTDIGLDLRALNDRLTLTADYFNKTTKDLIFYGARPTPEGSVFSVPAYNTGNVVNKGLEIELGYRGEAGAFKYEVNVNASPLFKNEVTYINPILGKRQTGGTVGTNYNSTAFEEGHSVWHFYGYKTNGIDKSTGDPIIVNAAGRDTAITAGTTADMYDIGSPIPKIIFGGHVKLQWKLLDLVVNATGQQGNKVLLGWYRQDKPTANRLTDMTDNHWSLSNTNGSKPAINADSKTFQSDLMLRDGSFIRIQTIQLGCSLPSAWLKAAKINSLRVFVSLDNFFTFTKYPGMDPQPTIKNNSTSSFGIDYGTYPHAKDIMFGANISF